MSAPYAALVSAHGLSASHRLVVDRVPPGSAVLDAGCATGYLAAELRARGCRVVGAERDPDAAAASRAHCEDVVVGDLEDPSVRARLPRDRDVVVAADVLEHLRDPEDALRFLAGLLAPGGRVVVSLPNVAVWHARRALARGRFPYSDHGVFDRTHLRFFTRAGAHALATAAGLRVVDEAFAPDALPGEAPMRRAGLAGSREEPPRWLAGLREAAARRRPELFALQFVMVLVPRSTSRAAAA